MPQRKCFEELRAQTRRLGAFGNAEVQAQLQLTDEQRGQIGAILKEGFQKAQAIRESLMDVQTRTLEKATAVLTNEQKSKSEQMQGIHFQIRRQAGPSKGQGGPGMAGRQGMRRQRMNLWTMPGGADTEMQAGTGAGMTRSEIRVQVQGLQAFGDAAVQAQLQLTDEQRERIREILREGFQEAKTIRDSLGKVPTKTMAKATAVLGDQQKSMWERIQEQFGMPWMRRRLRRRMRGHGMAGGGRLRGQGPGSGNRLPPFRNS